MISTGVVAVGELGDKTQLLALVLAARFRRPWPIVGGILVGTLGMLLVNVPTVFLGRVAAERIPFRAARVAAALLFAGLGVWVLLA